MPHPALSPGVLAVVLAGGCAGGLLRYALTAAPGGLLLANGLGALVLGALLVLTADRGRWWLRPAVGTGFCGALTTMSGVAVLAEERPAAVVLHAAVGLAAAAAGAAGAARWR